MCALKFESSYRLIASAPYPYLLDKKKQKDKQEIFFFLIPQTSRLNSVGYT